MSSISLLTLNCFGGWAPGTESRLRALARELEARDYDVVCLQEVQRRAHQEFFIRALTSYPYHAVEPGPRAPKGGLMIFSRRPILHGRFEPYREQGTWFGPTAMDRFLQKGMLIADVEWEGSHLRIIDTHLIANYAGDWERWGVFARWEELQLAQLAETVHADTLGITVAVGDFNIPRGCGLYARFLEHSGMRDPLAGDRRPTHRPMPGMPNRYAFALDFALLHAPENIQASSDLCLGEMVTLDGGKRDYLSDHHGVELRLERSEHHELK